MNKFLRLFLGCAALLWSFNALSQAEQVNVLMTTSLGEIEIELYQDKAPITVQNFLALVDGDHFNAGSFYRTVSYENDNGSPKIEVIQGGLNQASSPFPPIAHESTLQTGILHEDGTLSMARGGVGSASSEFFICIGDQPGLDHGQPRNADMQGFAAFGKVVRGMSVVRAINAAATDITAGTEYQRGQVIAQPIAITSVVRL
jgi:peptidyl-prolyl cis-trans isomerase A (cyclophilin A)